MDKKNKAKKEETKQKSAVDRLVEASNGDASGDDYVEKNEKQYHAGFLAKIPTWIKALLLKWWFIGAVCFFFLWGFGNYITAHWDRILILGLASGAVTNLLTNNLLRLIEREDGEFNLYMMLPTKKLWALFVDVVYGFAITILVVYTYEGINALIIQLNPSKYASDSVPLGVEPLLYGLFYLAYDMIFIWAKNLIVYLFKKNKAEQLTRR